MVCKCFNTKHIIILFNDGNPIFRPYVENIRKIYNIVLILKLSVQFLLWLRITRNMGLIQIIVCYQKSFLNNIIKLFNSLIIDIHLNILLCEHFNLGTTVWRSLYLGSTTLIFKFRLCIHFMLSMQSIDRNQLRWILLISMVFWWLFPGIFELIGLLSLCFISMFHTNIIR